MDRDVAQLVERWTGTPLRQVWFPVRPGIFLPESTFSADSFTVSIHPHVPPHALSPCQSSVDYGNTKTPNMDHRLGSMTVAAGFLQGKQPEFTTGEIPRDNTVVKKQKWQLPWFSTLMYTSLVWIVWNLLNVMGNKQIFSLVEKKKASFLIPVLQSWLCFLVPPPWLFLHTALQLPASPSTVSHSLVTREIVQWRHTQKLNSQ